MANLQSASIRESLTVSKENEVELARVADASRTLIEALYVIDSLVSPKRLNLNSSYLRRYEVSHYGLEKHDINVLGCEPIDEISEWQIIGTVGDRIVNVVACGIFHTFENNRSGNRTLTLNGKQHLRPEYGGITINDIWQESGLYKNFDGATSTCIEERRHGKVVKEYH